MAALRIRVPPKKFDDRTSPFVDCELHVIKGKDKKGFSVRHINDEIGKGVFATKDFRAGEFLLEYHGELISNEEACRREQCYPSRLGSFLFFFKLRKKELCIDATFSKRKCRYINDGCGGKQNSTIKPVIVRGKPHLAVFAQRNIKKGEEILYDYGVTSLPWREKVTKSSQRRSRKETHGSVLNKKSKCTTSESHALSAMPETATDFRSDEFQCLKRQGLRKCSIVLDKLNLSKNQVSTPEAPVNLTSFPHYDNVILFWEAPNNDGGLKIDGYFITMKEGDGEWHDLDKVPNSIRRFNVRNLNPGSSYKFRVGAENAVGRGLCLEVQSTICLKRRQGISKSPSHLTADSDNNNVLLTWESPEDDGGYQIECYCILMRETNTEWEIMAYCNGYKKEYTVECLKPGIPYFFAIAAVNKIGVGTPLEMDTAILLKERNDTRMGDNITALQPTVTSSVIQTSPDRFTPLPEVDTSAIINGVSPDSSTIEPFVLSSVATETRTETCIYAFSAVSTVLSIVPAIVSRSVVLRAEETTWDVDASTDHVAAEQLSEGICTVRIHKGNTEAEHRDVSSPDSDGHTVESMNATSSSTRDTSTGDLTTAVQSVATSRIIPTSSDRSTSLPEVDTSTVINGVPPDSSTIEPFVLSSTVTENPTGTFVYAFSAISTVPSIVPAIVYPVTIVSPTLTLRSSTEAVSDSASSSNPAFEEPDTTASVSQIDVSTLAKENVPCANSLTKEINVGSAIEVPQTDELAPFVTQEVSLCLAGNEPKSPASDSTGIPEAPLYLTVQPGYDKVLLSWEAPKNDGGFRIDGFSVIMKVSDSNWCQLAWVNKETTHYTVENLQPSKPYRFGVTAENIVGRGPCVEVQSDVYLQSMAGSANGEVEEIYISYGATMSEFDKSKHLDTSTGDLTTAVQPVATSLIIPTSSDRCTSSPEVDTSTVVNGVPPDSSTIEPFVLSSTVTDNPTGTCVYAFSAVSTAPSIVPAIVNPVTIASPTLTLRSSTEAVSDSASSSNPSFQEPDTTASVSQIDVSTVTQIDVSTLAKENAPCANSLTKERNVGSAIEVSQTDEQAPFVAQKVSLCLAGNEPKSPASDSTDHVAAEQLSEGICTVRIHKGNTEAEHRDVSSPDSDGHTVESMNATSSSTRDTNTGDLTTAVQSVATSLIIPTSSDRCTSSPEVDTSTVVNGVPPDSSTIEPFVLSSTVTDNPAGTCVYAFSTVSKVQSIVSAIVYPVTIASPTLTLRSSTEAVSDSASSSNPSFQEPDTTASVSQIDVSTVSQIYDSTSPKENVPCVNSLTKERNLGSAIEVSHTNEQAPFVAQEVSLCLAGNEPKSPASDSTGNVDLVSEHSNTSNQFERTAGSLSMAEIPLVTVRTNDPESK